MVRPGGHAAVRRMERCRSWECRPGAGGWCHLTGADDVAGSSGSLDTWVGEVQKRGHVEAGAAKRREAGDDPSAGDGQWNGARPRVVRVGVAEMQRGAVA